MLLFSICICFTDAQITQVPKSNMLGNLEVMYHMFNIDWYILHIYVTNVIKFEHFLSTMHIFSVFIQNQLSDNSCFKKFCIYIKSFLVMNVKYLIKYY